MSRRQMRECSCPATKGHDVTGGRGSAHVTVDVEVDLAAAAAAADVSMVLQHLPRRGKEKR